MEKRLVRSHHEVLHNMLDSGFRAAVNGIQRNGAGGVVALLGLGHGRGGGIRSDL